MSTLAAPALSSPLNGDSAAAYERFLALTILDQYACDRVEVRSAGVR